MTTPSPRWAALVCCVVLALVATACSGASAGPRPGGDTVVIALSDEPENLNPIFGDAVYSGNYLRMFDGLLSYGGDLSQTPALAAELPTVSPDGKTVTVRMRQGVTFHDGQSCTAGDVVFTYDAIRDPNVSSSFRSYLDALTAVEAPDPFTVRFTLSRVDPAFFDKLHMGILPKHLLSGTDLNTAAFNDAPVGTGPYKFTAWDKGRRLVLEANPSYFAGPANIPRVVFTFVTDENARAAALVNGSVDVAGVIPKLGPRFRVDGRVRVVEVPTADARVIALPNNNPVLADPAVRRALSYAVDRRAMVQGVLAGAGSPAYGPLMPGHWAASPVDVPYDPAEAGRLLEAAGWRDTDGDQVRDQGGRKLAFTLMYFADDSVRKDIALATRAELAEVGVEVSVAGLGREEVKARADQDATVFGYGTPYDPDLELPELFHSRYIADDDPFTNYPKMNDPVVDAALDAGAATPDRARRTESYRTLQQALSNDGSWLYLVRLSHLVVASNRVSGITPQVEPHAHGFSRGVSWNLEDWQLVGARP